ncbi:MAG: bifunctional 2-C-methyl-D-erythritol 4-phosphate cytidylyltransferase/2-C-methyl-D-erythritol 2,4-cyclodiphosphate synthase [Alphaproteobacteria bacterium]|nr:bifunctional 2-C-methyl-D-erythritol 4-phosphate cytidylyltransferase/2-C-methyl-D-erythritol 2,4-cyclodiphosphate synthase [Alphaproteobacteria bacterium]
MKIGAIIVAAGRGQRAGGEIPKQYRHIGKRTVIEHTLAAFLAHTRIDEVLTVINPNDLPHYEAALPDIDHVSGGATRTLSVKAGLDAMESKRVDRVLIHDAARPFVSAQVIDRVINALDEAPGALPVLAMTDALLETQDGCMVKRLNRDRIVAAQTPQGFHMAAISAAYESLKQDDVPDDATVLQEAGGQVVTVSGDPANFKITRPEDFQKAQSMLEKPHSFVIGQGYDVHRLEPAESMWLCGVEIRAGLGLIGHSDADAGLHALTDAILGAAGHGDIGQHFPPSDPQWAGASSDRFLLHAISLLNEAGGVLVNVDVTLICERPKVGPYRDAMKTRLAELTGLPLARVNIKATTTEKLGFTGRGEGLAAQAIVSARMNDVPL